MGCSNSKTIIEQDKPTIVTKDITKINDDPMQNQQRIPTHESISNEKESSINNIPTQQEEVDQLEPSNESVSQSKIAVTPRPRANSYTLGERSESDDEYSPQQLRGLQILQKISSPNFNQSSQEAISSSYWEVSTVTAESNSNSSPSECLSNFLVEEDVNSVQEASIDDQSQSILKRNRVDFAHKEPFEEKTKLTISSLHPQRSQHQSQNDTISCSSKRSPMYTTISEINSVREQVEILDARESVILMSATKVPSSHQPRPNLKRSSTFLSTGSGDGDVESDGDDDCDDISKGDPLDLLSLRKTSVRSSHSHRFVDASDAQLEVSIDENLVDEAAKEKSIDQELIRDFKHTSSFWSVGSGASSLSLSQFPDGSIQKHLMNSPMPVIVFSLAEEGSDVIDSTCITKPLQKHYLNKTLHRAQTEGSVLAHREASLPQLPLAIPTQLSSIYVDVDESKDDRPVTKTLPGREEGLVFTQSQHSLDELLGLTVCSSDDEH